MKNTTLLLILFTAILISCNLIDRSSHISYGALNDFLKARKLYERFDIQKINVDEFYFNDSTNYDNGVLKSRNLRAFYEFRIKGNPKELVSKAEVVSTDSVHWNVHLLTLTEKEDRGNIKYKKIYEWDTSKDSVNYSTQEFFEERQKIF